MNTDAPPKEVRWPKGTIFTVGPSTPPVDTFIELLEIYGIKQLVDIRTTPASRQPTILRVTLSSEVCAQITSTIHTCRH
jgi:hypothetical protein